ncbi:tRNA (adenosine(37)-N6)-dimethylallyltransferase MiaA [Agrococcus sp. HG114]|uniref:tRNA (adenosine(37)-N6)-dimethylallyltransferase MiaA n=1 Tax=Agrococcus sp. HG114 TaxID=2969757 RepID=UPI00215A2873|nr:tRNA (adenosine(37)-N6)-dimethylallyltransferase MiaA [Agrococcus sp. HG114]MCR8670358.1 tRNA (adenosine(37)-N6)-dimethylallyltransferase MiaA [Agrococcus sp. HG114]
MRLIAVVGATGTGKTAKSLAIADEIVRLGARAEIVNCDAMQLYRGMDIGTAKASVEERRGHPHHLIDVLEPWQDAAVAAYRDAARRAIAAIEERGAVPILVGGSGLYASSVLYAFEFPATDAAVRAELEADLERGGAAAMHERLRALDPAAAAAIGPHNGRRLVRALEAVTLTGEPFRVGLPDERALARPTIIQHERVERAGLVRRLDERVERMWRDGIVDEARAMRAAGIERGTTAQQAIGYRQALDQLDGLVTEADAIAATQALTRRYARRQVSWFQRYPAAPPADPAALARAALASLEA